MTRPLPSMLALAVLSSSSTPRLVALSFQPPPLRTVARRCRSTPAAPFGFDYGSGFGAAARPSRPSLLPPFGTSSSSSSTDSSSAAADSSTKESGTAAASTAPLNSSSTPTPPSMLGKSSPLYGGDYAGLSATFSSSTGELIRVPEHLVPDSMIEWGQVPSCLEVLTSEDCVIPGPGDHVDEGGDGDEDEGGSTTTRIFLERKVAAVMPEVGCGVDNLDVMRTKETFEINTSPSSSVTTTFGTGIEAFALTRPLPPLRDAERIKTETAFSLPTPDEEVEEAAEGEKESASDTNYPRRVRVSFDVVPSKRTVSSPVTVVRERQTSVESSGGTIGLGGGLDGRTVTRLVGGDNVNRPFAEGEGVTMDAAGSISRDGFTTLSLPGDVVIRIGAKEKKEEGGDGDDEGDVWTVDVGLVASRQPGSEDDDDGDGRRTLSVVRWAFGAGEGVAATWSTDLISEKC